MPLKIESVTIEDEIDRLEERRRELAEQNASVPFNSDAGNDIAQEGQQIDNHLEGLYWYQNEYEDADELVLSRSTYGEESLAYDIAEEQESSRAFNQAYVAIATQQAPFLEHSAPASGTEKSEIRKTIGVLGDFQGGFVAWAVNRINEIDVTGGGMGKSYRELVREKRIREASRDENGENTAES